MTFESLETRLQRAEQWARARNQPNLAALLAEAQEAVAIRQTQQQELIDAQRMKNEALDSQHGLEMALLAPPEELITRITGVLDSLEVELPRNVLHRILVESHHWWLGQSRRVAPDDSDETS